MSSNAISMTVIGNMGNIYIDTKVIEVMEHQMLIFHRPCRRRSIGPLPSCLFFTVVVAQCCSPRCGGAAATGKRDGRRETRLSDTEGMLASPCTFPQSFSVIPVKREESEGQSVGKQERGR